MAEPLRALVFGTEREPARMDPAEELDWTIDFSADLASGEMIQTIDGVVPTLDAAALGVRVLDGSKGPALINTSTAVLFWADVEASQRTNAAWDDNGTRVGVEVTVTTNQGRRFQKTGLITVVQL